MKLKNKKSFNSVDTAFSKYLLTLFFSKKCLLVTFSASSFNYQKLRLFEIKSTLEINNYITLHYMLIMHCARCEKRCYRSTPDKGNHGLPTIRCIWPIGYKENPTCMQARAEIMYRKLKLTKLISAIIQEREKQPSLFMGISLLENKHALWGEYINV